LETLLLVILIFVCVALVGVILLQKSEGGALGMGGGPSGFMSTRGVGDLLTRTTGILAGLFFVLCLGLTLLIGRAHRSDAFVANMKVQGLDPASLAAQHPAAPQPSQTPANPGYNPNAPLLEAPKPELHTAPGVPTSPILSAPAPLAAPAKPGNTTAPIAH